MKKITLKNLHEATAQEVFDQCSVHLLTQKEKCVTINGNDGEYQHCRYKYKNKKCAAGCLIDENEYTEEMEGMGWQDLILNERFRIPSTHKSLIGDLQTIHDSVLISPIEWKHRLTILSENYNLNTNAINNL